MGCIFGVDLTASGTRAAVWRNGRPVIVADDVPMMRLKAQLEKTAGVPAENLVLATAPGFSLDSLRKFRKSWQGTGLNVVRTVSSHTALALLYAAQNRFQEETTVLVIESDGTKTMVTLLDVLGDIVEELAFHTSREAGLADAIQQVLVKAGYDMDIVATALILDSEEYAGQVRYLMPPGSRITHYTRREVVAGTAIYGGILQGDVSASVMQCIRYPIGVETEQTAFTEIFSEGVTTPNVAWKEFPVPAGKNTLDISVAELCGDLEVLGSYRISNIPAGLQKVAVILDLDANLNLRVKAGTPGNLKATIPLTAIDRSQTEKPAPAAAPLPDPRRMGAVEALMPVYDNLLLAVEQPSTDAAYKRGVEQILKNVTRQLHELGAEPYGTVGEQFNPELHNAVVHMPDFMLDENVISRVFRRGFRMDGRILRIADVQVAN